MMNSLVLIPQYFCSSVMNPISAAETAVFSDPEKSINHLFNLSLKISFNNSFKSMSKE